MKYSLKYNIYLLYDIKYRFNVVLIACVTLWICRTLKTNDSPSEFRLVPNVREEALSRPINSSL